MRSAVRLWGREARAAVARHYSNRLSGSMPQTRARLFDYPDILRSPTTSILSRYQAGGIRLKLVWYGFMLTAILLAPLAVLMGQVLARDGLAVVPAATVVGVLAAVVQFLPSDRGSLLRPAS